LSIFSTYFDVPASGTSTFYTDDFTVDVGASKIFLCVVVANYRTPPLKTLVSIYIVE
jgi:hypothetical protein